LSYVQAKTGKFYKPSGEEIKESNTTPIFSFGKKKNSYDTGKIFYIDNSFMKGN